MHSQAVGRPMEILLVEDFLPDARFAIEALKEGRIKHRLSLVRDGQEALDFLHRRGRFAHAPRPDLVLLDLNLPKRDGREVLREMRAHPELLSAPVVVLTASVLDQAHLQEQHLEVDGYMTKPVDVEKFLALIQQLKKFWLHDVLLPSG